MKILLISSFLPYPLYSGGQVRLFNLISRLGKKHQITLICEIRENQTKSDLKEVEKICHKVIVIPRKKQWTLQNILKAGFSSKSFLSIGHDLWEMKKKIDEELKKEKYDLIHVETYYVYQNLPPTSLPVLLVEHNIEYKVYERFMNNAPFFLKPFLKMDINKIKAEEERVWSKATRVATVSEEDKQVVGRKDSVVIANGVDLDNFNFKNSDLKFAEEEKKVLYIGDYKWVQNIDAASFIIKEVWPEVKKKIRAKNLEFQTKLWIVGRNIPQSLKDLGRNDSSIIFDDNNQMSTEKIFQEAFILLSPKRIGGGTSYKILEAMASGTPVVTTSLGLAGLRVKGGKDLLAAQTKDDLASRVLSLYENKNLYQNIAENARKQVEKHYSWHFITLKLSQIYEDLISAST